MNRDVMIQKLASRKVWDICIIGGGATGLAAALDASSRGLNTILLEQSDFVKGTSSRSTKLVHGGVRYLRQGNIKLVREALRERGLLLKNAPHLAQNRAFIVPNYKWWEKSFYGIGLKVYDQLSGKLSLGVSRLLSKNETLELAPTLVREGLRGSVLYHDGQFDDARLAISMAQTAAAHGCVLLNYFRVNAMLKQGGKTCGVSATDSISGRTFEITSTIVINATGVNADSVMKMDDQQHEPMIRPSQGIHLVVDSKFLPGNTAVMIPRTSDGRVLFAVPWHGNVVIGTTDTPVSTILPEPVPLQAEIDFILHDIGKYISFPVKITDVKSIFAGLRPLISGNKKKTAALSRDFMITRSGSGLLSVIGGKWTTCRKMAERVIDMAIKEKNLTAGPCITQDLSLASHFDTVIPASLAGVETAQLSAWVDHAVKNEMCLTVEDFLSRRTRQLVLDARIALGFAPQIAELMQSILEQSDQWKQEQLHNFKVLAENYLPK